MSARAAVIENRRYAGSRTSQGSVGLGIDHFALAAWAFEMALLLEIAAKENPQPFFTAAERKQFRETLIPSEKVRVFLAKYEYGQHPAHAAIPLHTLTRRDDQQPFHLKISTITAGCLAMQVMSVRSRTSGELVYASSEMEFVFEGKGLDAILPIWPQPDRAFDGRRRRR